MIVTVCPLLERNILTLRRNQQEIDSLKGGKVAKPRLADPGPSAGHRPAMKLGSSLTGPAGFKTPVTSSPPPTFSLQGKVAMRFACQIAEEWTVGPIMGSHLTSRENESLTRPFFETTLRYQHTSPFLSDSDDVRDSFFHEFVAFIETEVQGGQLIVSSDSFERDFKTAFERRRPVSKKGTDKEKLDTGTEGEVRGLFQRFIERRRNVRGDRIGKPLAKFVDMATFDTEELREEPGTWRLVEKTISPDTCFFFTRPGARELFIDIYHPPKVKNRLVVSITQVVTLDASAMMIGAGRGAKSRGYERQVLALATEMAGTIAALGGHPCACCWTADVGGVDYDGADDDRGDADDSSDSQAPRVDPAAEERQKTGVDAAKDSEAEEEGEEAGAEEEEAEEEEGEDDEEEEGEVEAGDVDDRKPRKEDSDEESTDKE